MLGCLFQTAETSPQKGGTAGGGVSAVDQLTSPPLSPTESSRRRRRRREKNLKKRGPGSRQRDGEEVEYTQEEGNQETAVLSTLKQVLPVRIHRHPLIGSFLIPRRMCTRVLIGGCQRANSLPGLTGTESKQKQTLPCRQSGKERAHTGSRTGRNTAPRRSPARPGHNWYTGIPEHLQRRRRNPHVLYEIAYLLPRRPLFSPSSRSQPDNLSPPQPGLLPCNAAPVLLPEFSPRFDHNFQGCEGVRGRLRLLATWKDFSGSRVCPRSFLGPVPSFTVSVKLEHLSITVQLGLRMWDGDWSLRRECGLPEVSTSYCTQTDNPGM